MVAWLAGQGPIGIIVMAALLAILSVGGDAIQIAGLPSSTTNILMALILFFVLGNQIRHEKV